MNPCSNCSLPILEGAAFCTECGTRADQDSTAPPAGPTPDNSLVPSPVPGSPPRAPKSPRASKPLKERKAPMHPKEPGAFSWKRLGFLALAVVLILGAAVGGGSILGWKLANSEEAARAPEPGPSVVTISARAYDSEAEVAMPDLRGLDEATARQVLADSGIDQAAATTSVKAWSGPAGLVIEQTPVFGSASPESVALVLSTPAKVPPVEGRTASDVAAELAELGAETVLEARYVAGAAAGSVLEIAPAPGELMPEQVAIVVAEPASSIYLSNANAIDSNCSPDSTDMNGNYYEYGLVCRAGEEPVEATFLLSRVVDNVAGDVGIPDQDDDDGKAVVEVLADGKVVNTVTAQYGTTAQISATVTGALRLTIRITNKAKPPKGEDTWSYDLDVNVGLGDIKLAGGAEAMAKLGQGEQ